MSSRGLVIVESPAKAKTINRYLGNDYTVLASYGHVRDLPARDGSVRPDEDFAMDWELGDRAKRPFGEIIKAAKAADAVYLATDPDREGEAISWHVLELLRANTRLRALEVRRVTFNEITKGAVLDAMAQPRELNAALVEAYLARRALDYLVGFTLSPVLWRKLPGSRSAGRVQSVALRLICERESEIEDFRPREFWTIDGIFAAPDGTRLTARLTHLAGRKLEKFDLPDADAAHAAVARLSPLRYRVQRVERKQVRRNPAPPFTTSTLQQEASRKLGFSATQTMRVAQQLYEGIDIGGETVGLITYMRTDATQLAGEAVAATRSLIAATYGEAFVPDQARVFRSTVKNAQEAHEAIRPTDVGRRPEELARRLSADQLRLYELIWKRMVACQMASAVLDQVSVDIGSADGADVFRATGSVVRFEGFLRVYEEGRDDPAENGEASRGQRLPDVQEGADVVLADQLRPEQHFTQPPPRFTEASLVRRLEELGIGRPSTYAQILQVLQDRAYVRLEKKRFTPEDRGRLVTAFLTNFFRRYVEYDFTAKLEDQLDDISSGRVDWRSVLRAFWAAFSAAVEETKDLTITQVIDALDAELGPHFFRSRPDGGDARQCPACGDGRLGLRLSRTGAFIGCSNYPECRYTRPLAVLDPEREDNATVFPRFLGEDPKTGLPVTVRKGPFGHYAQRGPADGESDDAERPHRVSLTKLDSPTEIDLARALALLALPRDIGPHPDSGEMISAGIGRYGPYVKVDNRFRSLPADEDVLAIGMNRAVELLANATKGGSAEPLRVLGEHPQQHQPVAVFKGRFGPYVRLGKTKLMASVPRTTAVEDLSLDQAVELLDAKAAKGGGKAGGRTAKSTKKKADGKAAKNGAKAAKSTKKKADGKAGGAPAKAAAKRTAAGKAAGRGRPPS